MNSATLENTNNNMQPDNLDNKNMKADDSNLVDEILTELNDDSNINNGKNDIVSLTGSERYDEYDPRFRYPSSNGCRI